jgi:hypothetical protein
LENKKILQEEKVKLRNPWPNFPGT